jgi:hypothetical protein
MKYRSEMNRCGTRDYYCPTPFMFTPPLQPERRDKRDRQDFQQIVADRIACPRIGDLVTDSDERSRENSQKNPSELNPL